MNKTINVANATEYTRTGLLYRLNQLGFDIINQDVALLTITIAGTSNLYSRLTALPPGCEWVE